MADFDFADALLNPQGQRQPKAPNPIATEPQGDFVDQAGVLNLTITPKSTKPELIPAQAPSQAFDFAGALLGNAPVAPAKKPKDNEVIDDSSKSLGFVPQAVGSFASDDKEWVRYAAHYLYPNEPIDQAVKRFGQTQEGRWYHKDDEGKLFHVQPYSGWGRVSNIGSGVGKALPVVGGTAAGIVTTPAALTGVGLLGTMGAATGGAAGGELLRQIIGDYLLGEASTNNINVPGVAREGIESGLGQGIGMGIGQYFARNAVPDIGHYSQQSMQRLMDIADRYGVRLTPGEASNLAGMIAEQKRLQGVPQSANIMRNFSQERNREVVDAFNGFLNRVGQQQDPALLGRRAAESANEALNAAQVARTNAVTPLYQQAEQQIQRVDTGGLLQYIDQQLVHAKGPIQRALQTAREYLTRPDPNGGRARIADESFQGLNNAKMAIDSLMDPEMAARQGIDRHAMRELTTIRDRLVQAIDNAAGNNGAYQQGRQTYQQLTEQQVEPLQQALYPLLVGNREGANLTAVASNLFDPRRSPDQVAAARAIMMQRAPDLWNSLLRQHMREEATNALRTMADGELRNVAGGVSKAFSEESVTANLRAAMSPQQFRDFSDLMEVFRAAARSMDANSDTAFKQEMIRRAKAASQGMMSRVTRNINPAKLVENAADFMADRRYDRQAEVIANIITSGDRQAILRLQQLRQLQPNDWRMFAILGAVLERSGVAATEKALNLN